LAGLVRAHPTSIGVGAAVVGFLALCVLRIASLKPWVTADEYQHVDYALAVWRGVAPGYLPDTTQPEMPEQGKFIQHVANHPPLYPYLIGWILRLGVATGHSWVSVYLARGVTALIAAAAICLISATAYRLAGRRSAPAIGAALIAANCSPLVSVATTVMNDALFIALSCAVIYLMVILLADGYRLRTSVLLVLAATADLLTRSNAIVVIVASVVALLALAATPRFLRGGNDQPVRRAPILLTAGAITLVPILASGWFYLRNLERWGNLFGDHIPGIPYGPEHDSMVGLSLRPGFWLYLWNQLYGRPIAGGVGAMEFGSGWPARPEPIYVWALIGTLIAALVAVVGVLRWLITRPPAADPVLRGPLLVVAWAVPALVLAGTVAGTASHFAIGGSPHARYFLPGLAFIAAALAMAAQRWGRLRGVAMAALTIAGMAGIWTFWHSLLARPRVGLGQESLLSDVPTAMAANGFPFAEFVALIGASAIVVSFAIAIAMYVRVEPQSSKVERSHQS
jgi:hypothetical protein